MQEIEIKGIYKHFKGDYYLVEDIGYNADSLEECVIYRSLYDNHKLWIRPLSDFLSKVDKKKYPNIKQIYKFEKQNIKSRRSN